MGSFLNAHDAAASSQKQAINHAGYKNIVGLYHVPTMALIDTSFYSTLGETELKAGLGELTKNAALFGGKHYELMKKTTMVKGWKLSGEELVDATYIGLGAKDMLLRHDPKEKHLALLFEYGHTVGHALELTKGVSTSHGEGVTIGMLAASYISNRMGIMSDADRATHDALVIALDPKIHLPPHDITDEVLDKVMHDNKRGYLPERAGFCPFILNQRVGEMHAPNKYYLEYVPVHLVREAILWLVGTMRQASAWALYVRSDWRFRIRRSISLVRQRKRRSWLSCKRRSWPICAKRSWPSWCRRKRAQSSTCSVATKKTSFRRWLAWASKPRPPLAPPWLCEWWRRTVGLSRLLPQHKCLFQATPTTGTAVAVWVVAEDRRL